jgi:hypothetical protein
MNETADLFKDQAQLTNRMAGSLLTSLPQKPIIIGGCARSGTTLLLSVLSCHPNIYAIPDETYTFCPTRQGCDSKAILKC